LKVGENDRDLGVIICARVQNLQGNVLKHKKAYFIFGKKDSCHQRQGYNTKVVQITG